MLSERSMTKKQMLLLLAELGKEFRKRNGTKMKAELVIVGGAAIVLNYGFREMTTDIDAVIQASSVMKDAIHAVADKNGISPGWLNSDFQKTSSYSDKLVLYSRYYRTFSNVLIIRTIRAEYLVAMKLCSGRRYKRDLSDIVGIAIVQKEQGEPLTFDRVDRAMKNLYGGWDLVDQSTKKLFEKILKTENLQDLYETQIVEENLDRKIIMDIHAHDPGELKRADIREILDMARKKM